MKRFIFFILSILWISALFFPLKGKPKLGPLLNYSSGIIQIKAPEYSKNEIEIRQDSYSGSILIDSLGIPHIFAESDESLSFLMGYMHARDRLFQMEVMTRMMQARLAELVGEKAEVLDEYWINFQFERQTKNYYKEIKKRFPDETKRLDAYAEGINYYLEKMPYQEKPEEYFLLDAEPRAWEAHYSVLMIKYMAKMLNHRKTDLYLQEIFNSLPKELIEQFYPMQEAYLQTVIPEKTGKPIPEAAAKQSNPNLSYSMTNEEGSNFEEEQVLGSNNWLVAGKKSASGEAILSNDMHLALTLPGPWYEIQLKSKTRHLYGLSIPAAPVVIAGFNEAISWGMTNAHWDLIDYYTVDYLNETTIRYGNEEKKIEFIRDSIPLKNGGFKAVTIKRVDRGPIVQIKGTDYLIDWTGNFQSDELFTFMKLEKASNWNEYKEALSHFSTPPQNFVYADTAGNIGLYTNGKMPIKQKGKERGVFSSSDSLARFSGYLPYGELPHIYNPQKGFIASANQRQIYNSKHYYNWSTFSAPYRGKRISERLEEMKTVKPEDMKAVQADILDISARQLIPLILSEFAGEESFSDYLSILKEWDFKMEKDAVAPTIYQSFRWNLIKNLKEKILGRTDIMNPPDWVLISEFLKEGHFYSAKNERWSRKDLLQMSFQASIDELKKALGEDEKEWFYGKVHQTEFQHIMRLPAFSNPAFPSDGSKFTVNVARGNPVRHGSSQRAIYHMTTPIEARLMIAGGQSGRPSSPNFKNQLEDWKAVKTHQVQFVNKASELKHIKQEIYAGGRDE